MKYLHTKIILALQVLLFIGAMQSYGQFTQYAGKASNTCIDQRGFDPNCDIIVERDFISIDRLYAMDEAIRIAADLQLNRWVARQQTAALFKINEVLGTNYTDFISGQRAYFRHHEGKNVNSGPRKLANSYKKTGDLANSKRKNPGAELTFFQIRENEIKAGNINNSQLGKLAINNTEFRNLKTLDALNNLRKNSLSTFVDNSFTAETNWRLQRGIEAAISNGKLAANLAEHHMNFYYNSGRTEVMKIQLMTGYLYPIPNRHLLPGDYSAYRIPSFREDQYTLLGSVSSTPNLPLGVIGFDKETTAAYVRTGAPGWQQRFAAVLAARGTYIENEINKRLRAGLDKAMTDYAVDKKTHASIKATFKKHPELKKAFIQYIKEAGYSNTAIDLGESISGYGKNTGFMGFGTQRNLSYQSSGNKNLALSFTPSSANYNKFYNNLAAEAMKAREIDTPNNDFYLNELGSNFRSLFDSAGMKGLTFSAEQHKILAKTFKIQKSGDGKFTIVFRNPTLANYIFASGTFGKDMFTRAENREIMRVFAYEDYENAWENLFNGATYTQNSLCCPDDELFDPFAVLTARIIIDFSDAFFNILADNLDFFRSVESMGGTVRAFMEDAGIDVPDGIDDATLGRLFQIRKRNLDIVIEAKGDWKAQILDRSVSILDLLTVISPGKGVAGVLLVKGGGKITAKALSDYLKILAKGKWKTVSESMSDNAKRYQEFISGRKWNESFVLNNTKFDGLKKFVLLDAKSGMLNFVDQSTGSFKAFFKNSSTGGKALIDQAKRQTAAAKGNLVEWHFEHKSVRDAVEKLFENISDINIKLIHSPK